MGTAQLSVKLQGGCLLSCGCWMAIPGDQEDQRGRTIAGLTYDEEGNVIYWGVANCTHLVGMGTSVPCWRILRVSIWLRGFPGQVPHHGDQGWWYYQEYWAGRWTAVREVFDCFFGTGGWYERVRFDVEEYLWTSEEGWDYDDQI